MKFTQSFVPSLQPTFTHTHETNAGEPEWGKVKKNELPLDAYAVVGNAEDFKSWKYPHHFVVDGSMPDEHGHLTKGRLLVHVGGLMEATKQAEKDNDEEAMRHINSHWKTIDPDHDGHPLPDKTGINQYFAEKSVPRYAFSTPVTMKVGDNGEGAKSAPLTLIALSGEILDRPEWGPCIQDLDGFQHKNRIAVDYMHDAGELLGYVNKFDVMEGQLVLGGALVPQKTHKRTEEIIDNMAAGIPYEASIFFPPSSPEDLVIEFIQPGIMTKVNGKEIIAGQFGLTIFRKWVLRGVAICPHGADGNTAAFLQSSQTTMVNVKVAKSATQVTEASMKKEKVMELLAGISKETDAVKFEQAINQIAEQAEDAEQKKLAVEAATALKTEPDLTKKSVIAALLLEKFGFKQEGEEEEEEEKEKKIESYSVEDVKKFAKAFGARANAYMEKGMSFAKALEEDHAELCRQAEERENEDKEKKVKQAVPPVKRTQIRFQQTDGNMNDATHGLSEKQVQAIEDYAREFSLSEKAKQRLMEKHLWAQSESKRLGVYSPDAKAVSADQMSSTLTKIGTER